MQLLSEVSYLIFYFLSVVLQLDCFIFSRCLSFFLSIFFWSQLLYYKPAWFVCYMNCCWIDEVIELQLPASVIVAVEISTQTPLCCIGVEMICLTREQIPLLPVT